MSEENLGRVQGAGFFFSTAVSSTSADIATLSPSTIKPVYGDNIIFANGDIRNVTAVSDTAVTCGAVVANLRGADGVHIISSVLQGQDAAGGNIYLQTFSDNTTATFTAPRGLEGLGILYSSADADAQTTLFAKDSVTIPAGREIKVGDIIFCNAHLFSVNAVSETSFSVIHLAYFSTDSAQKDGNGNVIVDTYATKTQLSDGSVTKVGTATKGSSTQPIYLNAGTPTACSRTIPSITLNGKPNATPSFYAPTVDTGGRWLRGTGLGEPEWALPINIQDSYREISSNQTVPDLGVGLTGVICYFTSSSSTFTIYLPSSGEWAFAYQISNSYYNGAVEQVSSAKSVAWRNSAVSGGNAMCSIKGNGKYTSIMIIYTRTK